jgi:hypothetical protein
LRIKEGLGPWRHIRMLRIRLKRAVTVRDSNE